MTEEIFKGIEQVIDWEKYTQLFDEANQNRDTDYTLPMIKDIFKSDLQHLIDSVSADQNKELIEELETERKLGLKLNSDYTDLNTRLSAELSQQKELVEKKDATIEGYKNNTSHLYDQISTLKQEIEGLKKELVFWQKRMEDNDRLALGAKVESQSLRIKELEEGLGELWRQLVKSGDDINIATITKDKVKSLLSIPTTEEEKVLYTKSATVNSGDSINEEIFISKEEGKIGSPIQPQNPLDNAYEK